MNLRCTNCGREFDVTEETAARFPAARCACGARLNLERIETGERLGKYMLERRIAVGGMGEIFYAKIAGVEGFEREVAIKRMLPHLSADRSFIDMMVKEAKLTVLLNHPNIVQVFDLAREGDQYYIAMEYVPGTNVGQMLEICHRRRIYLPVEVAVYIMLQVLKGLSYAHQLRGPGGEPMNLLHRDITPQNILVTRDAWVKITDFGIAKARNEISTTSPGMIKGKLGYIAPEQLIGKEATQSVDIFCAGILLWESLGTKRLFKGSDEFDTFRLIRECQIPSLATIRDDVPPELEKAIGKALAPTPEERFASCDAFQDALNKVIFPRTADDLAAATRQYFAEHPEFFEDVITAEFTGLKNGETIQVSLPETITDELPLISELLEPPPPPLATEAFQPPRAPSTSSSRGTLLLAALLVVAIAGAGVAWWLTRPPSAPPVTPLTQEEVQLAVTAARNQLTPCYQRGPEQLAKLPQLQAELTVASTGGIATVELDAAPEALGEAASCLREEIQGLSLREHGAPRFDTTVRLPSPAEVLEPVTAGASAASDTAERGAKGKTTSPRPSRNPRPAVERPLTAKDIRRGVQDRQRGIARCLQKYSSASGSVPNQILTTMTVASSGRVTDTAFDPTPPPEVGQCLARQLGRIRYHRQPKEGLKVKFPLTIKLYSNGQ